ncbi:MAG: four helix bundle protein [Crocinitomicaceae bacterium]
MARNQIKDISIEFAIDTVNFCREIQRNMNEYILTKQLIRSGTSIGANIHEAEFAQSKMDFIHKLSIALKEANETKYWLEIFKKSELKLETKGLENKVNSIIRILSTIILNTKENLKN